MLSEAEIKRWNAEGYLIIRGFFSSEEIALVGEALRGDEAIAERSYGLADQSGGATSIAVWNHPGDDTLGLIPRLDRMVGTAEALLGGEVYHYHSKVTTKAPNGGGTWDWHQDYGYWYKNGCLWPDMLSVAIAVSEQTEENGCLRLLAGSHRLGRIDHYIYGEQTGADVDRMELLASHLPEALFLGVPGDVCFFHGNTLHNSSPNASDGPRELIVCAYNTAANDPVIDHHHPGYTPLHRVDDQAIIDQGLVMAGESRRFMNPADDISIESFSPPPGG
ncbi:MAG: phytanoyl-CoA dioxygenase family protein [Acidimicrobiales bacterium]